jgi:acyl-CoA hydrolase
VTVAPGPVQRPRRGPVSAEEVLRHIEPEADVIVPMANGEPVGLLDVLDAGHRSLERVRIHQMHALHPRPSIDGRCGDHLRHVSYFLSPVTRPVYWAGGCDLVPNHFS